MAAISASASPLLPDRSRADRPHARAAAAAARSRIERVTEALSFTGRVLGMGHTAVNPPRAAARVPVSMVSEDSPPGSRRWQCKSMKPGATIRVRGIERFRASLPARRALPAGRRDARDAVAFEPNVQRRVGAARRIEHASVLNPQHGMDPFGFDRIRRSGANQQEQQRHAHGQAVGDLFEHAGLRPVGHRGIDLQAANHRPGMQHQRVRAAPGAGAPA